MFVKQVIYSCKEQIESQTCRHTIPRWPITATAIAKRNTVKNQILLNKKRFCSRIKKVCFQLKKVCLQRKEIRSHRKKVCVHTQNKPTANSCGKSPRQKATAKNCVKSPRQIATANSHGK